MTIFYILLGILVLRYIGKRIWGREDKSILNIDPHHPYHLDKRIFPVGSGICHVRNDDRHIWLYSEYSDEIPYQRTCTFCGYIETKYVTNHEWHGYR